MVVSKESRIAFSDFERMHVKRRQPTPERRLPTPEWAQTDAGLRRVLLDWLESRLYIRRMSEATYEERLKKIHHVSQLTLSKKKVELTRLLLRYNKAAKAKVSAAKLRRLAILIQNRDSEIVILERGLPALATAVAYSYYRLGWSSTTIANELGIKPPMVRIWLYRMNLYAVNSARANYETLIWVA